MEMFNFYFVFCFCSVSMGLVNLVNILYRRSVAVVVPVMDQCATNDDALCVENDGINSDYFSVIQTFELSSRCV